jgi:hypothetical protein
VGLLLLLLLLLLQLTALPQALQLRSAESSLPLQRAQLQVKPQPACSSACLAALLPAVGT